jgi:vacuolar-type H+-ATPase subunit E/Vma4
MMPAAAPAPDGLDGSLDALERALRDSVAARTDTLMREASREADERIAKARHEAEALVNRARREGEATTDALLARERAALRRETVTTVLAAKSSVLDGLHARVRAAVLELRAAPDYPRLLDGLAARARAQLGGQAVVIVDPDELGGVIAELDSRRVDYTLPALAERAMTALGASVEELLR